MHNFSYDFPEIDKAPSGEDAVIRTADFRGEPSYRILFHSDDTNLKKGSRFNITVFISGAGDVSRSKVTVSIPPVLIEEGKDVTFKTFLEDSPRTIPKNSPSNLEYYYLYTNYKSEKEDEMTNFGERVWSRNPEDIEKKPVLHYSFIVSQNAPVGTHNIYLICTYKGKYSKIWYSNERIIDVYVRKWYEKQGFKGVALVTFVLTAIAAFIQIYNQYITNYLIDPIMFAVFWIFIFAIIIFIAYLFYDER